MLLVYAWKSILDLVGENADIPGEMPTWVMPMLKEIFSLFTGSPKTATQDAQTGFLLYIPPIRSIKILKKLSAKRW